MNRTNSFSRKNSNARIEDTIIDMDKTVLIDKANIYNKYIIDLKKKLEEIKINNTEDEIVKKKEEINLIISNIKKYKRLREEVLQKIKEIK
tara:strand:- start:61 stop:333 length:273 start_codon:yes stop_codon:yes gene_type:complete